MSRKLIPLVFFATVIVHIPDSAMDNLINHYHYEAEPREEEAEPYAIRRLIEQMESFMPYASGGRFHHLSDLGITWEVKE